MWELYYISPICPYSPTRMIILTFDVWNDIADIITVPNFVSIGPGVSEFWHPQFSYSP